MRLEYLWTKRNRLTKYFDWEPRDEILFSEGNGNFALKTAHWPPELTSITCSCGVPQAPSTFGSFPTLPRWRPNFQEVVGVENAVTYCRKGPGTSNLGFDPATLASCFVCLTALSEHLNWLGLCQGSRFPEALRKRRLYMMLFIQRGC